MYHLESSMSDRIRYDDDMRIMVEYIIRSWDDYVFEITPEEVFNLFWGEIEDTLECDDIEEAQARLRDVVATALAVRQRELAESRELDLESEDMTD